MPASPATTSGVVVFSTVSGMVVEFLHAVGVATHDITGPQATLIVGGLGLLLQVVKWVFDRRKERQ